ncbi:uncharacterized protein JN550_013499 [Neoarthrinium moseri]|uniref:uncharacterized protein n=1 Tax=Neoarthrinium moseri TaxID=1658444 RepID=UPI001FDDC22E|nr:uncharacterized protein JN550_013499 [Neoarthrinium moseri]KAI1857006.1 hypothetical protein JN550_013499 [Neoarthrinium moseri]
MTCKEKLPELAATPAIHPTLQSNIVKGAYPSPPSSPPRAETKSINHEKASQKASDLTDGSWTVPCPSSTSQKGQLEENSEAPNARSLSDRLGLENWRCGGLTLNKTPCLINIPKANRSKIHQLVESMSSLPESSDGLEAKLDGLAKLVHCRYHKVGKARDLRISQWRMEFPRELNGTKATVITVEQQIRDMIGSVAITCIAEVDPGMPCEQRIGGQKVQNCWRSIDEIVKPEVYFHTHNLNGLLKVLETNMYCSTHEAEALKYTMQWKSKIDKITGFIAEATSTEKAPQTLDLDFSRGPAGFWPITNDDSAFEVIDRCNKSIPPATEIPIYIGIQKVLSNHSPDVQDGFVYIFEVAGNKGLVKIGYTGASVEERLSRWSFDCNRQAVLLYPLGNGLKVPNPRRIESLCHAELKHCRIKIYCRVCSKQHIEWFETSPQKAIAVVQKWSHWMRKRPYEERVLRKGSKWYLKEIEAKKILAIQEFMDTVAADSALQLEESGALENEDSIPPSRGYDSACHTRLRQVGGLNVNESIEA